MKMYLPFGDWSDDGHGRYEKVLIDAPSMPHLRNAQIRIEEIYGKDFWSEFAQEYNESVISETVQQALLDAKYPYERFCRYMDDSAYDKYETLEEVFESTYWLNDSECTVTMSLVMDAFIWLLNHHGAQITRLDNGEDTPMINNWTCDGFRSVGYGCFLC